MASWDSVPIELLTRIFKSIDTAQQLAQCRLVCKSWDYPAETAMFSKEIKIGNFMLLERFYQHVTRKPARGRLIKHLNFNFTNSRMPLPSLARLFEICFTPNIEILEGEMLSDDGDKGYKLVKERVLCLQEKFDRLKYLGNSCFVTETYLETLHLFKKSLQKMDLQFTDSLIGEDDNTELASKFAEHLGDFEKLKYLDLRMLYDYSIIDMDKILANCPHLEHLRVSVSMNQYDSLEDCFEIDKIKKNNNLKTLLLYSDPGDSPILLDYCLTKYPNVEKITYESPDGPPGFADDLGDFPQELELLKTVPYYEMEFSIDKDDSMDKIRDTLKTERNDVYIEILDRAYPNQRTIEVAVKVKLK